MKKLVILFAFFIGLTVNSQEKPTELTVAGQAKLNVIPDITVVNIHLSIIDSVYSKAMGDLKTEVLNMKSFIDSIGINSDKIISESFMIDKEFDYNTRTGDHIFIGYKANIVLRLEFLNDISQANTLINTLSSSNTEASVNANFEMSFEKQEEVNEKLIRMAIKNAQEKAEIIADATSQELFKLTKISYGVLDKELYTHSIYSNKWGMTASMDLNIEPISITPKPVKTETNIIMFYQLVDEK